MIRRAKLIPTLLVAVLLAGCDRKSDHAGSSSSSSPAVVKNRSAESELTTIRLTPEAVRRLGIRTLPIEWKEASRTRTFPAEIVLPPDQVVLVSAPSAGVIALAKEQSAGLHAGTRVSLGEPVLTLVSGASSEGEFLSAADRISRAKARSDAWSARVEAQGQVSGAGIQVDAAKVKLERAESLHGSGAGSKRALDEARAECELAKAALAAAVERSRTIDQVLKELDVGTTSPIPIRAPIAGQIRVIQVAPGQAVPAGAPLFEVVATDPLWVRTSIYAPEVDQLDMGDSVRVRGIADRLETSARSATRVNPPANADPMSLTRSLYYSIPNGDAAFQPGQRVAVVFNARARSRVPVVPLSAILTDIDGGTWVYEQSAPDTYSRRRVAVQDILGNAAALERGPPEGTPVVVTGAAELFGTEFGPGK